VQSPYEVLGVDPDADEAAIRRAYRERAKDAHPDQGGSRREFQLVRAAYEELQSGESGAWADAVMDDARGNGAGATAGRGSDTTAGPRTGPAAGARADTAEPSAHVEFLNYDVLVDHDWSLEDDDLFERARQADLDDADYGTVTVDADETILEAVEDAGGDWPFSCRGGACANCAIAVVSGEVEHYHDHVLPPELTERGIQLSCIGTPASPELQVVFNVKHLPELEELRLPPRPS
jgi:ferredoxin